MMAVPKLQEQVEQVEAQVQPEELLRVPRGLEELEE
jgi:hypothetical protein